MTELEQLRKEVNELRERVAKLEAQRIAGWPPGLSVGPQRDSVGHPVTSPFFTAPTFGDGKIC